MTDDQVYFMNYKVYKINLKENSQDKSAKSQGGQEIDLYGKTHE